LPKVSLGCVFRVDPAQSQRNLSYRKTETNRRELEELKRGNDHEVEFHEIKILLFHEIEITSR
jgi:hypothetical protein